MPATRRAWYSPDRWPAELSQASERPEAPLARAYSVARTTCTPRRASCTAVETPKMPPPMTATREMEAEGEVVMDGPNVRESWGFGVVCLKGGRQARACPGRPPGAAGAA